MRPRWTEARVSSIGAGEEVWVRSFPKVFPQQLDKAWKPTRRVLLCGLQDEYGHTPKSYAKNSWREQLNSGMSQGLCYACICICIIKWEKFFYNSPVKNEADTKSYIYSVHLSTKFQSTIYIPEAAYRKTFAIICWTPLKTSEKKIKIIQTCVSKYTSDHKIWEMGHKSLWNPISSS